MNPTTIATVQRWFASAYGQESARVVRSASRTSGGLFQLAHDEGTSWLRVGGVMSRTAVEVEAEGRAAAELVKSGVSVAAPLRRADGAFGGSMVVDGESLPTIAYAEVEGERVATPTPEQASRLGEVVGALHRCGNDQHGLPVVEPLARINECIASASKWIDAEDARWLRSTVHRQSTALHDLEPNARTTCHGDLQLSNAHFVGDSPTLLDLEGLGVGPPAYDCACMWRKRVLENGFSSPTDWLFFKQGYERTTDVTEDHWRALPAFAVVRAVWTMSLPALPNAAWGVDWVRDPDYWRAHFRMVRWFADFAATGESA